MILPSDGKLLRQAESCLQRSMLIRLDSPPGSFRCLWALDRKGTWLQAAHTITIAYGCAELTENKDSGTFSETLEITCEQDPSGPDDYASYPCKRFMLIITAGKKEEFRFDMPFPDGISDARPHEAGDSEKKRAMHLMRAVREKMIESA